MDYSVLMVSRSQVVLNVRHEIRTPFRLLIGFWIVAASSVVVFAQIPWIIAIAGMGLVGSIGLAQWLLRPQPGSLARLIIDTPRRTIYWAHHGHEPEEVAFACLRALLLQSSGMGLSAKLWAVDLGGRRVELGHAPLKELEKVAVELEVVTRVPLWYDEQTPAAEPENNADILTHERAIESGSS